MSDEEVHVTGNLSIQASTGTLLAVLSPIQGVNCESLLHSNTEVIPLSLGNSPVSGHDEYGCHVRLQCAVEEGETLNVQHVHFVHKQHSRDYLGFSLLPPLSHLGVDLFPNLTLNLTCVT